MRIKCFVFVLASLSLTVHAGGVYRCNINGKTVYAASCPDGTSAKTVKVWGVPTGDDVAQAKAQSDAARQKLNKLEKEQAVQEKQVRRKRPKKKKVVKNTSGKSKSKVSRVRVKKSWIPRSKAKLATDE